MTTELKLPELAESMTSATLTAWLKQPGERVVQGEPIVEVDTDKTTVEIEAPVDGVLGEVLVSEGTEEVEVGTVLALIDDAATGDEDAPGVTAASTPIVATEETDAATASIGGSDAPDRSPSVRPPTDAWPDRAAAGGEIDATPLARRMAAVAGVELESVTGTGPSGRVRKVDVDRVIGASGRGAEPSPGSDTPHPHTDQPLSAARRVTAERLTRAKQTVPHFYLSSECDMSAVMEYRRRYNEGAAPHATLTDVVVRASALALGRVPSANSAWQGDGVRVFAHADIAVAVNTPTGLFTPIVRHAGEKALGEIARELRSLTARARDGQLTPDEYSGGSFTVSNLGMYGVSSLYAIVNPPQSCILGVGAVRQVPLVREGAVVPGHVATLTLSADHRALDGAVGGELLRELRALLEDPAPLFD